MTDTIDNEEVKEFVEKVEITPTEDDELIDEEETETPDSSSEEIKEPDQEEESEEEEIPEEETKEEDQEVGDTLVVEPKPVEGETPRERALRLEATRLKGLLREQRKDELFIKKPITVATQDEELAGFDPEQIKTFETIATKLGFARKDELIYQNTQDKLNSEFDTFIESHKEYAPENDKDGVLWNQFKEEFSLYNPPRDTKTLKKVLNKVHNDIYGVQPAKNFSKINASQEKIKVASHAGASGGKENISRTQNNNSGLRMDALKGFSEEEKKEIFG